jgi:hypothetical protein
MNGSGKEIGKRSLIRIKDATVSDETVSEKLSAGTG